MTSTLALTDWQIRRVGEPTGRPIAVPGCWEDAGYRKDDPGPFVYTTTVTGHQIADGERVVLRFGAVSYACTVTVDGAPVGGHVGMWDAFDVDVTDPVGRPGEHRIEVTVEKPASLTAGPDSDPVPGRYPTRQTLCGFLPYVWGHSHGGLWQSVQLHVEPARRLVALDAHGQPDGNVSVHIRAVEGDPGTLVALRLLDPDGRCCVEASARLEDGHADLDLTVPAPRPWSPRHPALYTVEARLPSESQVRQTRLGLRQLTSADGRLWLNGEPLHPRMSLSWGWYPDRLDCAPPPAQVRADLRALRALGYNGVKLCLWFPPPYYFDIADELGMLLWVEQPMWLPTPSAGFAEQLTAEADALVRAARRHPSVCLYTLGCELDAAVGAQVLEPLYRHVRALARDALVCDNSGSGEAYGGLPVAYADYYDHHLYCELEYLGETFDRFAPRWRQKPWLLGEFCDLDAYRDLRRLGAGGLDAPWWTSADPATNPQGARWQYDVPFLPDRLADSGWWERGAELERIGGCEALLHRKATIEAVRARGDVAGYVITGERDTPISTAGMLDDTGRPRFDAGSFAGFNADSVLLLGWDRQRAWIAGGDRPAYADRWCHESGAKLRAHVLVDHQLPGQWMDTVHWTLVEQATGRQLADGRLPAGAPRGRGVSELGVIDVEVPTVAAPCTVELRVRPDHPGAAPNSWRFWLFPPLSAADLPAMDLLDPGGRLAALLELDEPQWSGRVQPWTPSQAGAASAAPIVLASRWTPALAARVRAGGRALVALDAAADSPLPLVSEPFWREALRVVEPHPYWADFPHDGWADLQFFGVASDLAIDCTGVAETAPLLRRLDTRTGVTHDYVVDLTWGAGRALFTTLRFEGGRGDQPSGLARNVTGRRLLATWVRSLARQ